MNNMTGNTTAPQLTADNLKVLKDQIEYEALMNKKARQYGEYCTDTQLKSVCNKAADIHRQNFSNLKNYLDSHQ